MNTGLLLAFGGVGAVVAVGAAVEAYGVRGGSNRKEWTSKHNSSRMKKRISRVSWLGMDFQGLVNLPGEDRYSIYTYKKGKGWINQHVVGGAPNYPVLMVTKHTSYRAARNAAHAYERVRSNAME